MLIKESSVKKGLPKKITSICPECKKLIEATLRAKDGKVVIEKKCSLHGEFNDIVWSDVEMYLKAEKYASDGIGVENPKIKDAKLCPQDCGLCNLHLTHTALAVLDLTNRCNLMCPVCFANANASGYVYEPSMEMVVRMMENLRNNRPVPTPSIQFSGGEPTLHKNFLDIVKKAEELGFAQIQVATNGIKFADEEDFAQKCVDAGLDTIYLQFDGLDDDIYISMRGKKLLNKKIKAIENIRKTEPLKMSVCLVPTIINSVNDNQIGDIINFAIKNIDVVHAVNFQPVAFEGRISQEERLKKRFTLPDLVKRIEEQVGYLKRDDFYTVPFSAPLSELASVFTNSPKVTFSAHPHCGIATFLFVEDGSIIPITRFINVEKLMKDALKIANSIETSKLKKIAKIKALKLLVENYIDKKNAPKSLNIRSILFDILSRGKKESLSKFTWKTLMIGGMHFQDCYNYDVERVMRCAVHYPVPDGRIIPFCAYNSGPCYREEIEKKYSVTIEDWKKNSKENCNIKDFPFLAEV